MHYANQLPVSLVKWDRDLFLEQPTVLEETLHGHPDFNNRPVRVHYFAKMALHVVDNSKVDTIVVAAVSWYYPYVNRYICDG